MNLIILAIFITGAGGGLGSCFPVGSAIFFF